MFSAGTDLKVTAGPPTDRGGEYGIIGRGAANPSSPQWKDFALGAAWKWCGMRYGRGLAHCPLRSSGGAA